MIEKKRRPMAKNLSPIVLLDISYKIFMMMMKEEIENHLGVDEEDNDCQAGFTRGRWIKDIIFILHYVEKNYRNKKPLIVTAIEFSKAFSSVKREVLIGVLKEYRINTKIISAIANIYLGDTTGIDFG
ncbi:uncharacterized protein [Palaemon carinicauda]|uniref:uncharacterized protein n=1 Tax=Palaemon carinicauda TaxID=392227 RepID=UPI0035B5F413